MLALSRTSWLEILAEAWRVYPLEACGLLVAKPGWAEGQTGDQTGDGRAQASDPDRPASDPDRPASDPDRPASDPDRPIEGFVPIPNAARSSRVFELDPIGYMKAERSAEEGGLEIVGVVHSHTHTAAYPSPTDVSEASKPLIPPSWHWAIVSLAWGTPELRSFRVSAQAADWDTKAGIAEELVLLR